MPGLTAGAPAHLAWPFFDASHRALAAEVAAWTAARAADAPAAAHADSASRPTASSETAARDDLDTACRAWVRQLADAGLLRHCVPTNHGESAPRIDSRALCVIREGLAAHDGLADFAFAMQGLGSGAISLAGTDALRAEWLPRVAAGEAIAAFALSEPDAGSDVAAITTRATRTAGGWRLDGSKTWISNGGIADFYCVFARSEASATGSRGITGFVVPANSPGLHVAERIDVIAPHPLATLRFENCEVPDANRLGDEGSGFKLAMRTLDIFRVSVAAAAVGFARRALHETLAHASTRVMFGATLGTQPLAQAIIGDMATDLDAAALLTYRAAWQRDTGGDVRTTAVAAMAKLSATELAQRIIDRAVQLHGARGVRHGGVVERLYREIRSLRIYEGASEVQRLLVGREVLRAISEDRA